jgi:uncharacterized membrane protein YeiB
MPLAAALLGLVVVLLVRRRPNVALRVQLVAAALTVLLLVGVGLTFVLADVQGA